MVHGPVCPDTSHDISCTMASLSADREILELGLDPLSQRPQKNKGCINMFSLKARSLPPSLGICHQNCLTLPGSIKEKEQLSLIFPISFFKVYPHVLSCGDQTPLERNKNSYNCLELPCLSSACLFFTHPFVTRTPVGATSLLSASKDQRYKFWDDFLLVKSCTKIIPAVKDKTARCHLKIHILLLILPK